MFFFLSPDPPPAGSSLLACLVWSPPPPDVGGVGVVIIGSSPAAACLLPASRLGLRCRGYGGVLTSSSAGAVLLAVSLDGSGGGVLVPRGAFRACLACGVVSPSSPFYPTRRAGRGVSAFRRRGSFPSVSRRCVFRFGSACFLIHVGGTVPAIWS